MRRSKSDAKDVTRTPQGGLALGANFTRTGIFEYPQPDGTVVRELRHPDDVFDAESLASLRGAPVVAGHPDMITPSNWREHVIGHVGDTIAQNGTFVEGEVRVQDAIAVEQILAKALREISCGYHCDLIPESGMYDGQPYDVRQKNIRYNHVGLGPENWGRAGNDVRLHLDGTEAHPNSVTPEEILALQAQAKTDAAEVAKYVAENVALKAQVAELQAAASAEKLDALVTARLAVLDAARTILGADAVFTGKTDREIMELAISKASPDFKCDGRTVDFVAGVFNALTSKPHVSLSEARTDAVGAATSEEPDPRDAMIAKNKNAWKTLPTKGSK